MRTSEIKLIVQLDDQEVPARIHLDATDMQESTETRAFALSVWDHEQQGTLKIDLWTKEMPVGEMKRFYIETLGGLSDSLLAATDDEKMAQEIREVCDRLSAILKEQSE